MPRRDCLARHVANHLLKVVGRSLHRCVDLRLLHRHLHAVPQRGDGVAWHVVALLDRLKHGCLDQLEEVSVFLAHWPAFCHDVQHDAAVVQGAAVLEVLAVGGVDPHAVHQG